MSAESPSSSSTLLLLNDAALNSVSWSGSSSIMTLDTRTVISFIVRFWIYGSVFVKHCSQQACLFSSEAMNERHTPRENKVMNQLSLSNDLEQLDFITTDVTWEITLRNYGKLQNRNGLPAENDLSPVTVPLDEFHILYTEKKVCSEQAVVEYD